MKHASDSGSLPANVEQQRTRVSVDQDAPRHTSTVEYAGAYYGSGVDNSFSMERFARDFKIDVKSLDAEEMVFDMVGIDPAIANAFRRILLSEVPTMAIEKVRLLHRLLLLLLHLLRLLHLPHHLHHHRLLHHHHHSLLLLLAGLHPEQHLDDPGRDALAPPRPRAHLR